MASEDFFVFLSLVFKKFGVVANAFLSVICQFLNVGIINLSLEFYISHFGNKAINGFSNRICFICRTFYLIITKLNITQSTLFDIPAFTTIYSKISHQYCIFAEIISLMEDKDFNRIKVVLVEHKRTARWLSEALGKDPATVSKWCTNTTQPSLETLFKISELLQVPVLELIKKQNI